jgi:hypothetical protein
MLPLFLSSSWIAVVTGVVAMCRAGARADQATKLEVTRARQAPLHGGVPEVTRARRAPHRGVPEVTQAPLNGGVPGLTVWEHSDRMRLEHSAVVARRAHIRRRGASRRGQRRPAACA